MTERLHPTITMTPDAAGGFTRYQFHGTGPWVNRRIDGTIDAPLPGVWLVAQVADGAIPEIMRYDGTRYRSPTGAGKGTPWRTAAIQLVEPVTETQPGPVPPLHAPALGQALVDQLLKNYKRADVLNWFDLSPYNNPNEGEPEP